MSHPFSSTFDALQAMYTRDRPRRESQTDSQPNEPISQDGGYYEGIPEQRPPYAQNHGANGPWDVDPMPLDPALLDPAMSLDSTAPHVPGDPGTDTLLERQLRLQQELGQQAAPNEDEGDDADSDGPSSKRQKRILPAEALRAIGDAGVAPAGYFEQETARQPSTRGRGRGGMRRRGPRKAAEPTGDVKFRLNKASEAYLEGKVEDAIWWAEDAIRINAEIHRAWILLAQLYEERGEFDKRLTASMMACQLEPKNVDGWLQCAEQAIAVREIYPDRVEEFNKHANSCYGGALSADVECRPARHGRAAILLEIGHIKGSAANYLFLINRLPYDTYAIKGWAETTVLISQSPKRAREKVNTPAAAIDAYRHAITHFVENGLDPEYPFGWEDLHVYIDLLVYEKRYREAIHELRSVSRWMLSRDDESFWDDCDDDREWDQGGSRRLDSRDWENKHPDSAYGDGLPLDLRAQLACCRLRLGDSEEAERHLEWLDPNGPRAPVLMSEFPHLLLEVAKSLYETGGFSEALRFYEPLFELPDYLEPSALVTIGKCYLEVGNKRQAEECFSAAIDAEEDDDDDALIEARFELAQIYEAAREEEEAYILVNEAMRIQEARDEEAEHDLYSDDAGDDEALEDADDAEMEEISRRRARRKQLRRLKQVRDKVKASGPRAPRKPGSGKKRRRVFAASEDTEKEERARAANFAHAWQTVRACRAQADPDARGPSEELMAAAKTLFEDFRSYKNFYTWDVYCRHMGVNREEKGIRSTNPRLLELAERLTHNLEAPQPSGARQIGVKYALGYRGVPFNEWLDLILEYATGLAHSARAQDAIKVCKLAKDSLVFTNSKEDLFLIYVTMAGRDEENCVYAARYLMSSTRDHNTDAFRLFAALSRLCPSPASWYSSGPCQKFLLRQIRNMDTALTQKGKGDVGMDQDNAEDSPSFSGTNLDITLLMIYGYVLFTSNSFTYALNYLERARSLDPTNPMILLSVGQCYIQEGLKRQTDNRHFSILQGFVFLHQYYERRLASESAALRQEAHYNMARSYHGLGIPHLAVTYYRRVLQDCPAEADGELGVSNDLTKEAVFNMQQISLVSGDMQGVQSLAEEYLVV